MKKTIIYTLALAAAIISCTRQVLPETAPESGDGIVMSVIGLPATKAGETVASIHVYAFDEQGYLVEHGDAYGLTYGRGSDGKETEFSVDLTATSEYRRLHFIANYVPSSVPFGSESQLIGTLVTSGGASAYWQCAEMNGGIAAGTSYPQLRRIPLIRNIATVNVVSEDPAFTIHGYKITNLPDRGSIAPWSAGTGLFTGYTGESCPSYAALHDAGYSGTVPAGNVTLSDSGWLTGETQVYERPYPGDAESYTCIIIHGTLQGVGHDSYYKMDLVRELSDGSNEYLDILRNIKYTVTISEMGSSGYYTEAEARSHPAGNNISGSVNTEGLNNISDGKGQLFISDTEITFVDGGAQTFRYKFIPDIINSPGVPGNARVTVNAPAGAVLSEAATVASSDASDGWRTVTLRGSAPDEVVYTQTIRVTTDTGLSKNIRLTHRPKFNMTVSCSPLSVDQVIGTPVTVTITLPEGLPESFFPLQLKVSSDRGTVYPDPETEHMPVGIETGSYYYIKTVTRDDYTTGSGVVTCQMLTNTMKSAATVTVENRYFNTGSAPFANNPRYVTSFTIPARSMTVSGLSSRNGDSVYIYYDSARSNRINSTTYKFYPWGLNSDTTITVNSMLSTDYLYLYDTNRKKTVALTIEQLEAGGASFNFNA